MDQTDHSGKAEIPVRREQRGLYCYQVPHCSLVGRWHSFRPRGATNPLTAPPASFERAESAFAPRRPVWGHFQCQSPPALYFFEIATPAHRARLLDVAKLVAASRRAPPPLTSPSPPRSVPLRLPPRARSSSSPRPTAATRLPVAAKDAAANGAYPRACTRPLRL